MDIDNNISQEPIRRGRVIINSPSFYMDSSDFHYNIFPNSYQRSPVTYTISETIPCNSDNIIVPGSLFKYYKFVEHVKDTECCICCDEYIEGTTLQLLPCHHVMHVKCLKNWYLKNPSCPMCRNV